MPLEAEFSQSRNDLYWKVWAGEDGLIRWSGYDDSNWWDRVSKTDAARKRVGEVTGRHFVLDHRRCEVTVFDPPGQAEAFRGPTGVSDKEPGMSPLMTEDLLFRIKEAAENREAEEKWEARQFCGLMPDGQCTNAGSEECDWICGALHCDADDGQPDEQQEWTGYDPDC
jgi:hypothetical protein